jgi:hypothetical protein
MSRRLGGAALALTCALLGACSLTPKAPAVPGDGPSPTGPTDPASLKALELAPAYYWALDDGKGAVRFGDATGPGPSMGLDHSRYGDGVLPAAGMDSSDGLVGVAFTPGAVGSRQQQATIIGVGPLAPESPSPVAVPAKVGTSWAVSVAVWVDLNRWPDPQMAVLAISIPHSGSEVVPIAVQGDGEVFYEVDTGSNFRQVAVGDPSTITDGLPHLLVGTVTQDASKTTVTLYVDGALVASRSQSTAALGGMLPTPATSVLVGGSAGGDTFTYVADGIVGRVGVWNRSLSAADVSDLWVAGKP